MTTITGTFAEFTPEEVMERCSKTIESICKDRVKLCWKKNDEHLRDLLESTWFYRFMFSIRKSQICEQYAFENRLTWRYEEQYRWARQLKLARSLYSFANSRTKDASIFLSREDYDWISND